MVILGDGSVLQDGLNEGDSEMVDILDGTYEGVVTEVIYPNDTRAKFSAGVEYKVLLSTGDTIQCLSAYSQTGFESGGTRVLEAATGTLDGSVWDDSTPLDNLNGTHVLVTGFQGAAETPYIREVVPSEGSNLYQFTDTKPPDYIYEHKGAKVYWGADGEFVFDVSEARDKTFKVVNRSVTLQVTNDLVEVTSGSNSHNIPTGSLNQHLGSLLHQAIQILSTLGSATTDVAVQAATKSLSALMFATASDMGYLADPGAPTGSVADNPGTLVLGKMKSE